MTPRKPHEGMKTARLFMVLSSISPLFVIWAIRGNNLIPDCYFLTFCLMLIIIPYIFLWLRFKSAIKDRDLREITVGIGEDHREHLLVYLFTMLLPFYTTSLSTWRDISAAFTALAFIVFLFWHLNLHYMNLLFAAKGYRVFTVYPPKDNNRFSGKTSKVIITKRISLSEGDIIKAYRLSDTVYLEWSQNA